MDRVTKNIGRSNSLDQFDQKESPPIKRVLISRPNHRLGNLLLITPVIEEITNTFPDCKIDLFVRGNLAPIIFRNFDNVDLIVRLPKKPFSSLGKYVWAWLSLKKRKYDLVINVEKNSSSGKLSSEFANARFRIFGELEQETAGKFEDHRHMAKIPVYALREALEKLGYQQKSTPVPGLNLRLDPEELRTGEKMLKELVKNDKPTISIFTNATGRKCYSEEWWQEFYQRLLTAFPDYNIIEVLPAENISKINFKAPAFYSMDVREIGALLAGTELFIGADSGILHLSSAVKTTTVGLFSETDPGRYGPYGNNSFSINTDEGSPDDWVSAVSEVLRPLGT